MYRLYSLDTVKKLKKFRKQGNSIHDLMRTFSMPKTSVWHHIKDIDLSSEHIKILRSRGGMTSTTRRMNQLEKAESEAEELLKKQKKYYYALLAMLHWTEGNKKDLTFTNTNPDMIKVYINLLNKCFGITKDRIHITVRYFTGMSKEECLKHWSKVTGVSKNKISMYYNDGYRRGKSPYGMCRLTIRKSGYLIKVVQALIKTVAAEINAPVAQLD